MAAASLAFADVPKRANRGLRVDRQLAPSQASVPDSGCCRARGVGRIEWRFPKPQVGGSSPFRDAIFASTHGSTAGFSSSHLHAEFVVAEAAGDKVIHQEVD